MATVLDFIKKHKKAVFLSLLFFVVLGIGVSLPQPAMAACNPIDTFLGQIPVTGKACEMVTFLDDLISWVGFTNLTDWWTYPIVLVSNIINEICYFIANGVGLLFSYVLNKILSDDMAITKQATFLTAWRILKNWAIMVIDLSLIAAALMIILRLGADKAKQLLPKIIIVALLVNFSGVLVGLFIDASNIIMNTLLGGAAGAEGTGLILRINDAWNAIMWSFDVRASQGLRNVMLYVSLNMLFDVLYLAAAAALLFFALILIERYIILAVLFILSPLAFALLIAPVHQGAELFGKWWEAFIKYCFVGLGAAFFLSLSIQVLKGMTWNHIPEGDYNQFLQFIFQFSIVLGFMFFGLILTKTAATRATSIAIKTVTAAAAVTMGVGAVAFKGLKVAGRTTGAVAGAVPGAILGAPIGATIGMFSGVREGVKAGQQKAHPDRGFTLGVLRGLQGLVKGGVGGIFKGAYGSGMMGSKAVDVPGKVGYGAKDFATESLEWVGILTPGHTARARKERLQGQYGVDKETKETMDNASADQLKSVALASANTTESIKQKAYAILKMIEDGSINNLDYDTKKKLAQYAIASGFSESTITKGQPDLIDLNKGAIAKQEARIGSTIKLGSSIDENGKIIKTEAEKEAYVKRQALSSAKREAYDQMDKKRYKEMNDTDLLALCEEESADGAQALEEAVKKNIIGRVKGDVGKLLNRAQKEFGCGAVSAAAKIDPNLKQYDAEAIKKKIADELADGRTINEVQAKNMLVKEAYERLGFDDIRKMDKGAIDMTLIEATTSKKIREAGKDLSKSRRNALVALLPEITKRIAKARAAEAAALLAMNPTLKREMKNRADDLQRKYDEIEVI